MTEQYPVLIGDHKPIPSFQFSTETAGVKDQFDVWRDFMAPFVDVEPSASSGTGFRARAQAYDLGAFHLSSFGTESAAFRRTAEHARKSGIDHWILSVVSKGDMQIAPGDKLKAATADMLLQTHATPFSGKVSGDRVHCLFLNRDAFSDHADALDRVAGQNLSGAMAALLREFLLSLGSHASGLSSAEIPAVNDAFSHLLKATVCSNAETREAARLPIATTQFAMARRIINYNLKAPDLTPDMICARMGISRRQLYYIFKQHGGVMRFITQRRLAACHSALVTSSDKKRISSVAYEYGFTNLSSFYRQFQARYGFRPSEARYAWLSGRMQRENESASFADWLLRSDET